MAPPPSFQTAPSATGGLFFSKIMVLASFGDWGMMGERNQKVGAWQSLQRWESTEYTASPNRRKGDSARATLRVA